MFENENETAKTEIASENAEIRWGADGMFRVRDGGGFARKNDDVSEPEV